MSTLIYPCKRPKGPHLLLAALLQGLALIFTSNTLNYQPDTYIFLAAFFLAFTAYSASAYLCLRSEVSPLPIWSILVVGAVLHFPLISGAPSLSDDVYRYLWEGHIVAHGVNPYLNAPNAPNLDALEIPIRQLVNHPDIPSVYPPVAQYIFMIFAPLNHGPIIAQLLFTGVNLLTSLVILGLLIRMKRPRHWVLLYAWHPLPMVEFSHSAHMDILGILPMLLALYLALGQKNLAGQALATLSALIKLLGGILLWPLFLRGPRLRGLLLITLLSLVLSAPFLAGGIPEGLKTYAQHWSFNGAVFPLLATVMDAKTARTLLVLIYGLLLFHWRHEALTRYAAWGTLAFFILSPTAHPWYLIWALPFLALHPRLSLWLLSGTVMLSYHVLTTADPITGAWHEAWWIRALEYGPVLLLWLWEYRGGRPGFFPAELETKHPSPSPSA